MCSPLAVLLAVLAWRLLSKLGCCLFAPVSTSRLHYLRRCFISVSQFIWRVFARKQRRVLAASYLCIFYLCPDMFSVSLYVCVCVSVCLFSSHSSVFSGCLFQISVSVFCFSLFPLSHVIRSLFSYQFLARRFLFPPSSLSLALSLSLSLSLLSVMNHVVKVHFTKTFSA